MSLIYNLWLSFRSSSLLDFVFAIGLGAICGVGAIFAPALTVVGIIALVYLSKSKIAERPLVACMWLIIFITFTSAMERGRLIPMLAPNELVLVLVLVITIFYVISRHINKPIVTTVLFAFIILVLGTIIIPIIGYYVRGISFSFNVLFKWLAPAQYIFIFWIFSVVPRDQEDRTRILQMMFLCASVVAFIGLLQAIRLPFVLDILREWYPSGQTLAATTAFRGRVTSVLAAWNVLGTFLMINLLTLTAIQNEEFPRVYRINMAISAILSLIALLASGSFASIGCLFVGFIFLKIIDPRGLKALIPFGIAIALGSLFLLPNITARLIYQFDSSGVPTTDNSIIPSTLLFRFGVWRDIYVPLIAENPLWGAVPTFENLSFSHAESQYIFLLVRSGFVSLVAFLVWLLMIILWLFHIMRENLSITSMIALSTFTSFGLLAVMGLTNPVFTYTGVMDYMWIYLGLIANSQHRKIHLSY